MSNSRDWHLTKVSDIQLKKQGPFWVDPTHHDSGHQITRKKVVALCKSTFCLDKDYPTPYDYKVKNVKFSNNVCPDCGHALFWEQESKLFKKRGNKWKKKK